MKKFYVLIVVTFGLLIQGFAQTYAWIGGASGNWNLASNWNPAGIPDAPGETAIFTSSAVVTMDAADEITLDALRITNSGTDVSILSPDQYFKSIILTNTSPVTGALTINPGAFLRLNTVAESGMYVIMAPNSKGFVDGTLYLDGTDNLDFVGVFWLQGGAGNNTLVNISSTGSIVTKKTGGSIVSDQDGFLNFNAGSELRLEDPRPIVPWATYSQSSDIFVTGLITGELTFEERGSIGNLTFDCPGLINFSSVGLPRNITVAGNINILNTNAQELQLMSSTGTGSTLWSIDITGDLIISNNSRVALSTASTNDQIFTASVRNVSAGGLSFSLQRNNNNAIEPTTLIVRGNIEHTNGTFTASSTAINNATDLFTIEMAGAVNQTISSSAASFDNNNNQVTLKINKTTDAGVVNLLSPLAVGRLNLVKGKLNTTSTNYLTIRNTSGEPNVMASTPNSFVVGPLSRMSASTEVLEFPLGAGSTPRIIKLTPETDAVTTFTAEFKNESLTNTYTAPLEGIEQNYYWTVNRVSGTANAEVELTLNGAIAGAEASDAIIVAKHDGTNWVRATGVSGNFINPGDLSTGTAGTDVQTSFGSYTFGFAGLSAALPITLESFDAKKVSNSAQLNWRISEGSNPVSFEVMKAADGINFSKLGTITAFDGKLRYDFTDNSLFSGNNYYRLKMLDKDGKTSYSSIVVVMNETKGVMISSMIPTMVIDRARLNITSSVSGNMQLVVTDISGRVVHIQNASINSGNQEIWLNANRLSSGIFQVTGYIKGEKTATIRFFKR